MPEPKVAQKAPFALELEPGEYWWCACGESKNQPFCDGSHKGSEFRPKQFTVETKKKYWLCGCKNTKTPASCDGTHKNL